MKEIIRVEIKEWWEKYKPLTIMVGCVQIIRAFKTDGKDWKFIKRQPPNKVWSFMQDTDSDNTYTTNGMHHENCLGYYVTEESFEDNVIIWVP